MKPSDIFLEYTQEFARVNFEQNAHLIKPYEINPEVDIFDSKMMFGDHTSVQLQT